MLDATVDVDDSQTRRHWSPTHLRVCRSCLLIDSLVMAAVFPADGGPLAPCPLPQGRRPPPPQLSRFAALTVLDACPLGKSPAGRANAQRWQKPLDGLACTSLQANHRT